MKNSPKTPNTGKKQNTPAKSGGGVAKKTPNAKISLASPVLKALAKTPAKTHTPVKAVATKTPSKSPVKDVVPKTPSKAVKTPKAKTPAKNVKEVPISTPKENLVMTPISSTKPNNGAQPLKPSNTPKLSKQTPKKGISNGQSAKKPVTSTSDMIANKTKEKAQLYVKIITHMDVTSEDVKEGVEGIFSVKMIRKLVKQKQKVYLVQFTNEEAAEKGKQQLQSKTDKVVSVSYRENFPADSNIVCSKVKLFLTGCPQGTHMRNIAALFPDTELTRPKSNRNKKGTYFVEFKTPEAAEKAFQASSDLQMKGNKILVTFATEKVKDTKASRQRAAKKAKMQTSIVEKLAPLAPVQTMPTETAKPPPSGSKRKAEQTVQEADDSDSSDDEEDLSDIIINDDESGDEEGSDLEEGDDSDDSLLDDSDE